MNLAQKRKWTRHVRSLLKIKKKKPEEKRARVEKSLGGKSHREVEPNPLGQLPRREGEKPWCLINRGSNLVCRKLQG